MDSEGHDRFPSDASHAWNARQRQWAVIAWIGGVLSVLLLAIECRLGVVRPASLLFLLLIALAFVPGLMALAGELRRLVLRQRIAPLWAAAAFIPAIVWILWGGYAYHQFQSRENPHNLPMRLIQMAGASVMEARAVYLFPHRIETPAWKR